MLNLSNQNCFVIFTVTLYVRIIFWFVDILRSNACNTSIKIVYLTKQTNKHSSTIDYVYLIKFGTLQR